MRQLDELLIWDNKESGEWRRLTDRKDSVYSIVSQALSGVYVIFSELSNEKIVVWVGSAENIGKRLDEHENSEEFSTIAGGLLVTWANLRGEKDRLDEERYLGEYYKPTSTQRLLEVMPLKVSPPFWVAAYNDPNT